MCMLEREAEREEERQRQREKGREREERKREKERETERDRERHRETQRDTESCMCVCVTLSMVRAGVCVHVHACMRVSVRKSFSCIDYTRSECQSYSRSDSSGGNPGARKRARTQVNHSMTGQKGTRSAAWHAHACGHACSVSQPVNQTA